MASFREDFKKVPLDSLENIKFFETLIQSGVQAGELKQKYGLKPNSYLLIKAKRIDMDNKMVTCAICGKEMPYITPRHLQCIHNISQDKYFEKYPDAKYISATNIIESAARGVGVKASEETKEKMSLSHTGFHHSEETIKRLSDASSGENNPAKRQSVRDKIKRNHASNDAEKWKEIKRKISESKKRVL